MIKHCEFCGQPFEVTKNTYYNMPSHCDRCKELRVWFSPMGAKKRRKELGVLQQKG